MLHSHEATPQTVVAPSVRGCIFLYAGREGSSWILGCTYYPLKPIYLCISKHLAAFRLVKSEGSRYTRQTGITMTSLQVAWSFTFLASCLHFEWIFCYRFFCNCIFFCPIVPALHWVPGLIVSGTLLAHTQGGTHSRTNMWVMQSTFLLTVPVYPTAWQKLDRVQAKTGEKK